MVGERQIRHARLPKAHRQQPGLSDSWDLAPVRARFSKGGSMQTRFERGLLFAAFCKKSGGRSEGGQKSEGA